MSDTSFVKHQNTSDSTSIINSLVNYCFRSASSSSYFFNFPYKNTINNGAARSFIPYT